MAYSTYTTVYSTLQSSYLWCLLRRVYAFIIAFTVGACVGCGSDCQNGRDWNPGEESTIEVKRKKIIMPVYSRIYCTTFCTGYCSIKYCTYSICVYSTLFFNLISHSGLNSLKTLQVWSKMYSPATDDHKRRISTTGAAPADRASCFQPPLDHLCGWVVKEFVGSGSNLGYCPSALAFGRHTQADPAFSSD